MSKKLVSFKNVTVRRSGETILENITFDIFEKEIISVIGLNGAGKTSLLKTILGIYQPSSGKIQLNTKKIGYVPQKLSFDHTIPISVIELLKIYSSKNKSEITKTLKEVKASSLLNRQLSQLSGGELQKVLIANALLQKPQILLLDEPTAGIDIAGEHNFYDLLTTLHQEYEITIILVSHDIHTVFAKASRIFCLNKHLCCQGAPDDVSKNTEFKSLFCDHLAPYSHNHDHHHH